jgi:hypothetical protein
MTAYFFLSALVLLLAFRMFRAGTWRDVPAFWASLIVGGATWWGHGFEHEVVWLMPEPVLLLLRVLAVAEWFWWATLTLMERERALVRYMAGVTAAALGLLSLLALPRAADWFAAFIALRERGYLVLELFLLSELAYLWCRPAKQFGPTRVHGPVLAVHLGVLAVMGTTGEGGLTWLVLHRTYRHWAVLSGLSLALQCGCMAAWLCGWRLIVRPVVAREFFSKLVDLGLKLPVRFRVKAGRVKGGVEQIPRDEEE